MRSRKKVVDHLLRYSNTLKDDILLLNSLKRHLKKVSA